jgi:hypothetical protein
MLQANPHTSLLRREWMRKPFVIQLALLLIARGRKKQAG